MAHSTSYPRCPACGHDEIYRTKVVLDLAPLERSMFVSEVRLGSQLVICAGCGRLDWYCGPDSVAYLRELATKGKYAVRHTV